MKREIVQARAATGLGSPVAARATRQRQRAERQGILDGKGDGPTREQERNGRFETRTVFEGAREAAVRRRVEPLDEMRTRCQITRDQWRAGDRFRRDREATLAGPSVIGRYDADRVQSSARADLPQHILDAQQASAEAMNAVPRDLRDVIEIVVVGGNPAAVYARRVMVASPAVASGIAMDRLRLALSALARHYGYSRS